MSNIMMFDVFRNCSVILDRAFGSWEKDPVGTEDVAECNADIESIRI